MLRFLILLFFAFNLAFTTYSYQNPYQTLRVGPFHSLSYIFNVYKELLDSVSQRSSSNLMEKLEIIKRAYLEIKLSRMKEKEDGPDELIKGILYVAKQCTMAVIFFYLALVFIYYFFKLFSWIMKEFHLFFIMNIVIFHFLQNFFAPLITNVKLQYMFTILFSVSVLYFRYYSRKQKEKLNPIGSYGVFQDEPNLSKVMDEVCVENSPKKGSKQ